MAKKYIGSFLKLIKRTLVSTVHPLPCHIVVTRRCHLSCAYHYEDDKVSNPVPLDKMKSRIEALANHIHKTRHFWQRD